MCRRLICLASLALALGLVLAGVSNAADPDLVGWWKFEESGGTLQDSSDQQNNGSYNGTLYQQPGVVGYALGFDGTDDRMTVGSNGRPTDTFSFGGWMKTTVTHELDAESTAGVGGVNGQRYAFDPAHGGDANGGAGLSVGTNGISVYEHGSNYMPVLAAYEAEIGDDWNHIMIVYDNKQPTIYLNGQAVHTGQASPRALVNAPIAIGGMAYGYFEGLMDEIQIYSRALTQKEVERFVGGENASDPSPANEATDIPRDVVLDWDAGEFAATHDVYFGTSLDDVNDGVDTLVSQGQTATSYDPDGLLEIGQTYYWRVDEVNAAPDNTVFKGEVWSFTVEPFAYPIANVVATSNGVSDAGVGPERTIDGSGLNADDQHSTESADMWLALPGADALQLQYDFDGIYKLDEMLVWNYNVQFELMLGFGLKDVTVEYSADGETWDVLGEVTLAQATAKGDYAANTVIAFNGVPAKHVRLTVSSGYGPLGQFGLSEVRFMFIPAQAREPQPADGATGVDPNPVLNWRVGRDAVSHDVYLSTDEAAVADGTALVDTVTEKGYAPGALDFGSTYFWRIDEVQEAEFWAGDVWDFTVQEYAVIDDMESYNDDDNRIFDTWLDGFVNGTGSTVGYFEAPFAETTIVNSGSQSMPLEYNNADAPFYSEAELDLGSADWTTNGADTLRLFVAGQAPAFFETADGSILMNAIGTDIWDSADEFRYAYKTLTGDGSMVARVDALDGAPSTWAKAGVMVRQSTAGGSTHSFMCMTGGDGNGASWQGRLTDNVSSENADATSAVAPPYWVRIDRAGDSLTGSISPDGETWTQLGDARTIAMADPVLIGLALTSHNANMATSAVFSNVSMTGSGGDVWQVAEIGVAQPEGNIPEALYVAIEDTSGNVAVVTHPDPGATAIPGWTEWLIPYSDLAGVNLSRVAIMVIGVGDRDNPTAGGPGLIFVDDIGYGHPAAVAEQ